MFDIAGSGTVEIFNLAKKLEAEGKQLIHLEVGELDFDTPKYIIDATIKALKTNLTKYTETKGLLSLRKQIAAYIKNRYELTESINPKTQILVTPGAKFGLFASLLSFASPGDELLVFAPSYPSYRSIPEAMKIKVKEIPILDKSQPIPKDEIINNIKSNLSDKTRFFILNGPCNPTGQVIYPDTLKEVWEVCKDYKKLLFLADDIYEQYIYPPATFETPAVYDQKMERTILINGFSKSFCMTGFRLGYIVSNARIIEKLGRFQQNSVTCATTFVQKAGEIALQSYNEKWDEYLNFRNKIYSELNKRRLFLYKELNNIPGISCGKPEGAFYVFPNISELNIDSHEFCKRLLEKGVVTTPGDAFGVSGKYHLRICYSEKMENLKKAIDSIKDVVKEL